MIVFFMALLVLVFFDCFGVISWVSLLVRCTSCIQASWGEGGDGTMPFIGVQLFMLPCSMTAFKIDLCWFFPGFLFLYCILLHIQASHEGGSTMLLVAVQLSCVALAFCVGSALYLRRKGRATSAKIYVLISSIVSSCLVSVGSPKTR